MCGCVCLDVCFDFSVFKTLIMAKRGEKELVLKCVRLQEGPRPPNLKLRQYQDQIVPRMVPRCDHVSRHKGKKALAVSPEFSKPGPPEM